MFKPSRERGPESAFQTVAQRNSAVRQLEELIGRRRSVRRFEKTPLALEHVSQLLWAAQGKVGETGFRTVPSAGALYPLDVYAVAGAVNGLEPGVYKYRPRDHNLSRVRHQDCRDALCEAALDQEWVRCAPVDLVIVADYTRTTDRYHDRGLRYVYMEAGHAAQNVYLIATALGLATVAVGAFDDDIVARILNLPHTEHPLYIMPIGIPRAGK